jgi:polar amino acid transport system ATP-binding protein
MPNFFVNLECGTKAYGDVKVLDGIDLTVERGEVLCIIGPSGVGKSTLLRCLTLLETFDRGTLIYEDVTVCRDDGKRAIYSDAKTMVKARDKFGLVFQALNLFPHYTVKKNIMEPLTVAEKIPVSEAEKIAMDMIDKLELNGKEDNVPCDLSGGQQQRVAIARALAQNPEVLYFDEPTSALDPRLARDVANLIRRIAENDIATVIVTHDMSFARLAADRIAIMSAGKFVEVGETEQIFENPQHEITKGFLKQEVLNQK